MPSNRKASAPGAGATLDDWLAWLEAIHPLEMDLGLERVLLVFRRLLPAGVRSRVITVGGTNGKGSTVAVIETLLQAAGQSVGCYTSPHLLTYNERVRLNGAAVSDAALIRAFERIEAARGSVTLTYFEFGTLAALLVMEEAGVANMVLEVGLGGRLDAVNILDADLAIITSVDLDHTAWLGDDRETIGYEKAGILRPGQNAIFADEDPPASVLQQARAQGVKLLRPGQGYRIEQGSGAPELVTDDGHRVGLPLLGLPMNSLAAGAVASIMLALPLSDSDLALSLCQVRLAGRFEQVGSGPDVFLDVGHNPHAAAWLGRRIRQLKASGDYGRIWAVYAGLEDKDSAGVSAALASAIDRWFLAGLDIPRGLSAQALEERVTTQLEGASIEIRETVADALSTVLSQAAGEDLVLVFGSFFTVIDAKRYFDSGGNSPRSS